jgi:hypothetical protein
MTEMRWCHILLWSWKRGTSRRLDIICTLLQKCSAASGYSSGTAIKVEVAAENLEGMILIGQVFLLMRFLKSGHLGIILGFVYLVLAAQWSFILPLSVILTSGLYLEPAFIEINVENNIYAQVAMVRLIGLLGKNAVWLWVCHSATLQREICARAAMEGAKARFRPILMTSLLLLQVYTIGICYRVVKVVINYWNSRSRGCLLVQFAVYLFRDCITSLVE